MEQVRQEVEASNKVMEEVETRLHLEIQVDIQARQLFLEFSNWILTHMSALGILRPGFYTEFRAGSI